MKVEIIYLKKADKFFNKNKNFKKDEITALVLKALKKIILNKDVNIDIKKLKGNLSSYYRIRFNKVRILFEVKRDKIIIKAIINDIDFRGSVY